MKVAAAWFTAAGDYPRVRAAFSTDGGQRFSEPTEVDETNPSGRVGVAWRDDRTAIVSWITAPDAVSKKSSLALRKVHADGSSDPIHRIKEISGGRDSGVPQLAAYGSGFMIAWTAEDPAHGLHTVFIPSDAPSGMER